MPAAARFNLSTTPRVQLFASHTENNRTNFLSFPVGLLCWALSHHLLRNSCGPSFAPRACGECGSTFTTQQPTTPPFTTICLLLYYPFYIKAVSDLNAINIHIRIPNNNVEAHAKQSSRRRRRLETRLLHRTPGPKPHNLSPRPPTTTAAMGEEYASRDEAEGSEV